MDKDQVLDELFGKLQTQFYAAAEAGAGDLGNTLRLHAIGSMAGFTWSSPGPYEGGKLATARKTLDFMEATARQLPGGVASAEIALAEPVVGDVKILLGQP